MKNYNYLLIILLVSISFSNRCLAQNQINIDSLKKLIQSSNKTERVSALIALGKYQIYTNADESEKNFRTALKEVVFINKKKWESDILNQLGVIHFKKTQLDSALIYYKKSYAISEQLQDSLQMAINYSNVANILSRQAKYDLAIQNFLKALKVYEKKGSVLHQAMSYGAIGNLHISMKEHGKALSYFEKAAELLEKMGNKQGSITTDLNIAICLEKLNRLEEGKVLLKKVLKESKENNFKRNHSIALTKLGKIYLSENEFSKAESYFIKALNEFSEENIIGGMAETQLLLGKTTFETKQYKKSLNHFKKGNALIEKSGAGKYNRQALKGIISNLKKLHREKETVQYYDLLLVANDTVFNLERRKITTELLTKYEVTQKNQEIVLLTTENELKEKEAQRQDDIKKAILIGLFLTLLLAGLIFYTLKQKLKNQKIIAAKNEELKVSNLKKELGTLEMKALRAQMNPHFLFNCMNSINTMILRDDNAHASKYLTKFSKLVRLMLENSENPKVTLQDELDMLNAYVALESIRFKGKITYTLEVSEVIDKETTLIPSMVLQPFVENAIWHGLLHTTKKTGKLSIKVHEENDFLHCSIMDNGVGREAALKLHKKAKLKKKSMGIKITTDRLTLLTKEKIKEVVKFIDLKDDKNNALGTQVDILIPIS